MTADDIIEFICQNKASKVLQHLADMPWADRRKHAKPVMQLFKATIWVFPKDRSAPKVRDEDAVVVAVLATATLAELKAIKLWQLPKSPRIDEVLRALQPDWIADWVDFMVANNPHTIPRLAPIWENGLCPRPTSDAFILGYYAKGAVHSSGQIEEDIFLSQDVWRFFEVEGGGEFSLAASDKYAHPSSTWERQLLQYADAGKLNRGRLLDASLDALDRDFGQFVAGWYARFHKALNPSTEEIVARAPRYLRLLSSTVPPTVSFAIQAVQTADKAQAIPPARLLDAIGPALTARAKGTVTAGLRLIASAAKGDPSLSTDAAKLAVTALVAEDAGLQGKVLDLIEKLGCAQDDDVRATVAEYVPLAAPSVRVRMAALAGALSDDTQEAAVDREAPQATPIVPVATADEALALFLSVLENHRDPFAIERAMDGVARFGASLRASDTAASPLKKRARQLFDNPNDCALRLALAITGCDLAEATPQRSLWQEMDKTSPHMVLSPGSFGRLLMDRNAELLTQVINGHILPMLSMPSDTSGHIAANDLCDRLTMYREHEVAPGSVDFQMALLRLAPDGAADVLPKLSGATEFESALMYALGAEVVPGVNAPLWAAAWAACQPVEADPRIADLFKPHLPDCGLPASLKAWREDSDNGQYYWPRIAVPVSNVEDTDLTAAIPAMFYPPPPEYYFGTAHCGAVFEDVAWVSLLRPGWQEPFFRQAILSLDTYQKLSDHYCLGFLEPLFRPGITVGLLGHAMLVYYLASEDKSVSTLTADAIAELALLNKLDVDLFSDALSQLMMIDALPTGRWTKGLATVAQAGAATFSREVITQVLDFTPDQTPRNIGGMLELLYELHISSNTAPHRPETLACLRGLPGGGKIAKCVKQLLKLSENG
ncbi:MAG: DUF6493 family protein [Pseudomonadota bacterium]